MNSIAANPALRIVARAHSEGAAAHLSRLGADLIVSGEREIARRVLEDMQAEPGTGDPGTGTVQGGSPACTPAPPSWTAARAGH